MNTTKPKKLIAGLASIALSLSLGVISPAQAATATVPLTSTTTTAAPTVWVTQVGGSGSLFGVLEWTPVSGASKYLIHKTGTIRPYWRLFWVTPATITSMQVTDLPGAIAVYRVTAVVNGKETVIGRFNYRPKK